MPSPNGTRRRHRMTGRRRFGNGRNVTKIDREALSVETEWAFSDRCLSEDRFLEVEADNVESNNMPRTIFVTRHHGAIEWARDRGIAAEAVDHLDIAAIQTGDTVLGTLPVHLAAAVCAKGAHYFHLEMDLPSAKRGMELSAAEMEQAGARLIPYHVVRLKGK
jgi:CRISPR-associated protein Csx16